MARNGSGTFSSPYPNFVSGTVISSTQVDANNSDIATALTQSIAVDGQSTVTANLPMNAKKLTGLAVGAAATDSLNLGQAQAEAMVWCGTAGGSANAITLSPTPAITAYAAGQRFVWKASGSVNTGATTVAVSGLGTIALQDNGAAFVAGNHAANKIFMGILDTTSTVQVMQVQISGTDPLIVSSLTVNGASQLNGTLTAGLNGTGYDVILYGDTAGKNLTWDQSADSLIVTGTTTLVGTTNLDAVDIDGAVQIDGIVQIGVDGTGYDLKLYGDTAGKSLLWDQSADSLIVTGTTTLVGTTNLDAVDIDGAVQIDATLSVGVDGTGYDVKFFGATSGAHMLWDESADDLKLVGAAGLTVAGNSVLASVDVTGLATAATFEPDGDTAAGDNAAIGYTAAEGLILTGQGSTSDVTIKNDADATVMSIPTGTSNVGIGTTAASGTLHAKKSAEVEAVLGTATNGHLFECQSDDNTDGFEIYQQHGTNTTRESFVVNDNRTGSKTTAFSVRGDGVVFINPCTGFRGNVAGALVEQTTLANTANVFYMFKVAQVEMCMGFAASTDTNFYIGTATQVVGASGKGVYLTNGATSWTSNSDFRKKKNLVPIENALDKIANCRAMTGHFNNEADDVKKRPFLIAQDWVTALPEAVDEDTVDDDGVENLGLSYEGTVPLLVAAIKELREQNIALTSRITALEG
jgi:hypothetical protein